MAFYGCHGWRQLKSVNLQYITLGCLDDGTNESSTKSLMFQVLFFYTFYRLRALKTLYFYFCNFIKKNKKINWKDFCKEFCKKSWKKIILGTSDAWSTIRLSHRPSDPAYYIVNWRISGSAGPAMPCSVAPAKHEQTVEDVYHRMCVLRHTWCTLIDLT